MRTEFNKKLAAKFGPGVKAGAEIADGVYRLRVAGSPALSAAGRAQEVDGEVTITVDTCAPAARRAARKVVRRELEAADRLDAAGMTRRAETIRENVAALERAIAPETVVDAVGLGVLADRMEVLGELRRWLRDQETDVKVFWQRELPVLGAGADVADWHGELGIEFAGVHVTGGRGLDNEPWFRVDGGQMVDADQVLDLIEHLV